MRQYVPEVTEEDVERIVRRDYRPDDQASVWAMIGAVEVREKPRVILSCLKVAQGEVKRLKGELANASGWYREIISEAEYPGYTKVMFRIERLSAEEVERIIERDKAQYLAWLHRP